MKRGQLCYANIGKLIFQFRWLVLLFWLAAAGGLALLAPQGDATLGETSDLLPSNTPVHLALDNLAKHFGDKSGLSAAVVVFERRQSPLTSDDLADIERVAQEIPQPLPGEAIAPELIAISIRSPSAFAFVGKNNPLMSDDGHAALIWVSLPYNYITKSAARVVKHTQAVLANHTLPERVTAAVTGSAGYGYDYAVAIERSHRKTSIVTLISVVIILLLVYRAPIAVAIPLAGISLAAIVTFKLLAFGEGFGVHSGTAERIFTFVLLYGAGLDYSLLFMSRYREFLDEGRSSPDAVGLALGTSIPTIASSAAMTMSGLVMLCLARFSVFRHAGPAVVVAIAVAALAAGTLVPAILAIIGPVTFWPAMHRPSSPPRQPIIWPAIARLVTARPGLVMTLTLIALALPAVRGSQTYWNYGSLFSLKSGYQARDGTEMVERHWPTGEIAPITVLAVADQPQTDAAWLAASARMLHAIAANPDVDNVRAYSQPLGIHAPPAANAGILLLAHDRVRTEFISPDGQAMRMSAVLNISPLTPAALNDAPAIAQAARQAAAEANLTATIQLTGATAEIIDLRDTTQQDFRRIAALSLLAILLVVWAVLRDLLVAVFILAATVLSYLTTLGLTCWVFQALGAQGLEWKVQMLLFIVLVAVGQDYSIFLALRLAQEARRLPCREAMRRALIFTGPVISSCGLIMAATLGSVMAGDVQLLVQLGFAFALGMLIDTFIVRPLLLPSLIVLTGRTLRRAAAGGSLAAVPASAQPIQ